MRLERVASAAAGASGAANFQAFIKQQTHERTPSASQLLSKCVNEGVFIILKRHFFSNAESTGDTSQDVDEYTFRWQEKLFSHAEYERYARIENCRTDLQQQYNRKVIELQYVFHWFSYASAFSTETPAVGQQSAFSLMSTAMITLSWR